MQVAVVHGDRAALEDGVYGDLVRDSQLATHSPHSAASADLDLNALMRAEFARESHLAEILRIIR